MITRRLLTLLLLAMLAVAAPAQTKKPVQKKATPTQQKKTTPQKGKESVKGLQDQKKKLQQQRAEQERKRKEIERDVKQRMDNLLIITQEINHKRRSIDTIRNNITALDQSIAVLDSQLTVLNGELEERQQRYIKSMRYMHRNRSIQNKMLFVFSANDFNQMYRRMRFMNEYADYQRAQGEAVKQKQEQVAQKQQELADSRTRMATLLARGEQEQQQLEGKQQEQQKMVSSLQQQKKTIDALIERQRQEEQALNQRIEKMIAEEMERARLRAEAEAKAEAKRKREAEEAARRKALAEQKKGGGAAQKKGGTAEQRKAATDTKKGSQKKTPTPPDKKTTPKREVADKGYTMPAADRQLSGSFASNKGKLPMPIVGAYKLMKNFGANTVAGTSMMLQSHGIELKGQSGALVRSVFDGEVSIIFQPQAGDPYVVMVRHGNYITVYGNLRSVSVSRGQHVSTRQTLGAVGTDGIMQFQLRNWREALNPMRWLSR